VTHIKRRYEEEGKIARSSVIRKDDGTSTTTVLQVKDIPADARARIQELRNVIHSTFVGNVPALRTTQWTWDEYRIIRTDLYEAFQKSKERIREIAIEGGKAYEDLSFKAKFAWTNYETMKQVRSVLAV